MNTDNGPKLCFGDLPELDYVTESLSELAEVANHAEAKRFVENSPIPVLISRIDSQVKWQRDECEISHPGAFDRSYLAEEYTETCDLLFELTHYPWELPEKFDLLVLKLHRVMILGNLTEDELCKTLGKLASASREAAELRPIAETGRKFIAGRKSNTGSPVRKAIATLLKNDAEMKNRELWKAIKNKPPRGWTVMENTQGKYIEGSKAGQNMSYTRFSAVAKEERDKLTEQNQGLANP
jgi:hypothetical protein